MPSQFFGLHVASSGLRSSQAALNTTANNIANTQTPGFSRQQVVQEASDALRTFTTYGSAGAGVDVLAIERVRNHFYDVKYWNNASRLGKAEVQQYYMRTLEDYFEDDEMSGFNTLFNRMSAALQSVTTNASSTSTKADFVSSMKALTDYFNSMFGNMQEMQNDLNLEIKQTIDEINSIAEKLSILNRQINIIEMGGPAANELRDQREKLIDRLSLLVDVEVDEFPIVDVNDPTRLTGGTMYTVRINGGQILTRGNEFNRLMCEARMSYEKLNQTDIHGLFDVKWENGNDFGLQSAVMGGKLRGLVEMRDGNNGFFFNGRLTEIGTMIYEGVPTSTAIVSVTDVNLMDMKLCNLSDTGGRITIGGQIYYYQDWSYQVVGGIAQYTFILDNDRSDEIINSSKLGTDATCGRAIQYQGVPYYMTQMNAWLRGFAEKVNEIFHGEYTFNGTDYDFVANGFDALGNAGSLFFTGRHPVDGEYGATDLLAAYGKGLYALTAGNITIFEELMRNADRLGSKSTASVGNEESEQVKLMIQLLNSKEMFSFRNGTAKDFLEMILGDIALNASNANTFYNTYRGMGNAIDNQRSSISGVDEDEEAVNLVKFQNAYNLSSRMIQTLTEIYNRLILQTGV
ncbi:MAG: flagellar hook-associated protein FlgK [Lachnospiraceae bacterium]|jgi:flagellar hook-associated protein 1 FlgK|nr:flagellar hook-associated protein FlgK [Lachnospiraceae bacterium]